MSIPHAVAGGPVSVFPAPGSVEASQTMTLIKTSAIEVIRLVVPAGKELAKHQVPGEITLQCIAGRATLHAGGLSCELAAGTMTYLTGGQEHSLTASEDSTLLLTIQLAPKGA